MVRTQTNTKNDTKTRRTPWQMFYISIYMRILISISCGDLRIINKNVLSKYVCLALFSFCNFFLIYWNKILMVGATHSYSLLWLPVLWNIQYDVVLQLHNVLHNVNSKARHVTMHLVTFNWLIQCDISNVCLFISNCERNWKRLLALVSIGWIRKSESCVLSSAYWLVNEWTIRTTKTLKSPEHGLGINMGKNLNYPLKSK